MKEALAAMLWSVPTTVLMMLSLFCSGGFLVAPIVILLISSFAAGRWHQSGEVAMFTAIFSFITPIIVFLILNVVFEVRWTF